MTISLLIEIKEANGNLKRAIAFLNRIMVSHQETWKDFEFETAQASLLYHFERAFEHSASLMIKYITEQLNVDIDRNNIKEVFQIAAEHKMITNVTRWMEFSSVKQNIGKSNNGNHSIEIYPKLQMFIIYLDEFIHNMNKKLEIVGSKTIK